MVHRAFLSARIPRAPAILHQGDKPLPQREVEITHLWFETNPPTQILNPVRPLPARLRLDETFETWIPVADVPTVDDLERMVRVQLSNGKVVKSRLNKGVPPTGYIAGPGSS